MTVSSPDTPALRYDDRLRRRSSAETLRGQLVEAERTNVLTALRSIEEDPAVLTAAIDLVAARRRTVIGVGRSHFHAALFEHSLRAALGGVALLGSDPEDSIDALTDFGPTDALVAFSFRRYRGHTIAVARMAAEAGANVVAITDRADSPIASFATSVIVVPTEGGSHLDSPTTITLVGHVLSTLAAARAKGARRRLNAREVLEEQLLDYSVRPREAGA
ncbi:SIS domain-containing protein [Microbacterium sp. 4R-513]|uniref:MurR/RpiR family transcriptional regulator n=1 Tax=Microbacterium sp. 4R-513 TaxID=2567934 RepID=UPI0013E11C20|nr:SIS domain-containing protein [Microbacterium sp. 4R-513]QIG39498.1 SIS domain-containing protein [Microbacterium sp. 4R-513]